MRIFIEFNFLYLIILTWFLLTHKIRLSKAVERSSYIIHMDKSSMPKAFSSHHHWYTSTVDSLNLQRSESSSQEPYSVSTLIYSYDNVMHGFSALLSLNELESIKKSPGFVSSYIDREVKQRTTHTPKFLSLNPSTGIWPASNYGEDVIVGVIDSGVWPESPSFNDNGMTSIPAKWRGICEKGQDFNASSCNLKLIGARFFNKGLIASKPDFNITMNSPRDNGGHGTHCASIAVGNFVEDVSYFGYAHGTASGMAPRARLAVYKAYWNVVAASSDIVASIDQAVADGVDIISFSQGYDEDVPFYENAIAIAFFGAMERGIFISHAGGNTGPGLGSLFDSMPWSMTVAAGSVDRQFVGTLTLGNGLTITGWSRYGGNVLVENIHLNYNKTLSSCNSTELLAQSPYGIIICEKSDHVLTQIYSIKASLNNIAGVIYISDDEFPYYFGIFLRPGIVVSSTYRSILIDYAKNTDSSASMKFKQTILGSKPAPYVVPFSSRGPSRTYNGILKPDILAPGLLVLAAVSAAKIGTMTKEYSLISGTSMSCPHIAGVAALLKSAQPNWSPAMIRSAIMTTANPLDNTGKVILEGKNWTYSTPLDIGSGHVDPNRALDPGLVYDTTPQDYVNVLCYMNYTKEQLLMVTRSRHYNCSNASPDLNYPSFIALYSNTSLSKSVTSFQRILTNVGSKSATYYANVLAPPGSKVTVSPNILVFHGLSDRKSFSMRIEYDSHKNETVTHGSLTWIEDNENHKVRSPIVVSPEVKI